MANPIESWKTHQLLVFLAVLVQIKLNAATFSQAALNT